MLIKYSTLNKKTKRQVIELVGKPYTIWQRFKMNGNGSQRFQIVDGNSEILDLLKSPGTTDPYINIELRSTGLILHIRVRLDNWALVLPYHGLSIFSQNNHLNIYSGQWKIRLTGYRNSPVRLDFIKKVIEYKNNSIPEPLNSPV
jgi:hypothetical protein